MKNLILFFAFLFVGSFAYSQQGMTKTNLTAEEKADEVTNKLKSELSLTDVQVPKVKEITLEKINKVTEAQKKYGKDKTRLQAANKLIYSDYENKLKGVLTEDQFKKFLESKGQH